MVRIVRESGAEVILCRRHRIVTQCQSEVPLPKLHAITAFNDNYIWAVTAADGATMVVDPGSAAAVNAFLAQSDRRLCAILITHHHADHIGGLGELRTAHRAPCYGPHDTRIDGIDVRVNDGDQIAVPELGLRLNVVAVPGHTRSHIAYHGNGWLFCGDTLFSLGCGRLFEGTPAQMLASLDSLAALPGATAVCCAHEYTQANGRFALLVEPGNPALAARIAQVDALRASNQPSVPVPLAGERATNPFLRVDEAAIVRALTARHGKAPTDRVEAFAWLRQWKDTF